MISVPLNYGDTVVMTHGTVDRLRSATNGLKVSQWLISPYLGLKEIDDLSHTFNNLARYENADPEIKKSGLEMALTDLSRMVAPNFRNYSRQARIMTLYMQLPSLGNYSHILEMAIIDLYRFNHLGVIYLVTPLFEGIVRAMKNTLPGGKFAGIVSEWKSLTPPSHLTPPWSTLYDVLHNQIQNFFEEIFRQAKGPTGVGNFNRHYLSHALGAAAISAPGTATRALMAFEALAAIDQLRVQEMLSLPDSSMAKKVDNYSREDFYQDLVRSALDPPSIFIPNFLDHHPKFDINAHWGEPNR